MVPISGSPATSHSTSMSSSGNGSVGERRVQRITESANGSPDATPSVNGSDVTAAAAVVVVASVVEGVLVEGLVAEGLLAEGALAEGLVVAVPPDVDEVEESPSSPAHAATVAA